MSIASRVMKNKKRHTENEVIRLTCHSDFTRQFSTARHQRLPTDTSFDGVGTVFAMPQGQGELIFIVSFAKDEVMEKIMDI